MSGFTKEEVREFRCTPGTLAERAATETDPDLLWALSHFDAAKKALVQNPHCPLDILLRLGAAHRPEVQSLIEEAKNPETPPERLRDLAMLPWVFIFVAENRACPPKVKRAFIAQAKKHGSTGCLTTRPELEPRQ